MIIVPLVCPLLGACCHTIFVHPFGAHIAFDGSIMIMHGMMSGAVTSSRVNVRDELQCTTVLQFKRNTVLTHIDCKEQIQQCKARNCFCLHNCL